MKNVKEKPKRRECEGKRREKKNMKGEKLEPEKYEIDRHKKRVECSCKNRENH